MPLVIAHFVGAGRNSQHDRGGGDQQVAALRGPHSPIEAYSRAWVDPGVQGSGRTTGATPSAVSHGLSGSHPFARLPRFVCAADSQALCGRERTCRRHVASAIRQPGGPSRLRLFSELAGNIGREAREARLCTAPFIDQRRPRGSHDAQAPAQAVRGRRQVGAPMSPPGGIARGCGKTVVADRPGLREAAVAMGCRVIPATRPGSTGRAWTGKRFGPATSGGGRGGEIIPVPGGACNRRWQG